MNVREEDHEVRVRQLESCNESVANAPRLQKPCTKCCGLFDVIAL